MASNYAPSKNEVLNKLFNSIIDDELFLKNENYDMNEEFLVTCEVPDRAFMSDQQDAIYIYIFNGEPCVSVAGKNAPLVRLDVIELAHKYGAKFRCLSKVGFNWQGQVVTSFNRLTGKKQAFDIVEPDYY